MKYTKKVWIPALIIALLIIIIAGFAFINSISNPDKVLEEDAKRINNSLVKKEIDTSTARIPDMTGIEKDAMLKDIEDHGNLDKVELTKLVQNDTTDSKLDFSDVKSKSVNIPTTHKLLPVKGLDPDNTSKIQKDNFVNITKTYKTPYFAVNYPGAEWGYAEGKSMELPSYVDIPRKTAVATVEFFNKKSGNKIFLHISESGGADFDIMTSDELKSYLQYIYNDNRIKRFPIEYINGMRFVVLSFVPGNGKQSLVKQYLTTKSNYLYCITFIEEKTSEINQKMINEVLGSILVH